jgi:sarcosine oxidase
VERVDAVVVGGGVMGSASAWALARRGRDVVVLEQFGPGHTRGSSHGASRIFRLAYPDPFWVRLARHAEAEWRRLEADSAVTLLTRTGSVDHGDPGGTGAIAAALTAAGEAVERLDPAAAAERWPGLHFDGPVVHQPDGGRIDSARTWAALVDQVRRRGGRVRWQTPVRSVEAVGDRVHVVTDDETYDAAVAVISTGGWLTPDGVPGVALPPLVVTQESAFHFAPRDLDLTWPSFIHHGSTFVYGLETPGEGVKVAEHHTGPVVTADARDGVVDPASRRRVSDFVGRWLPGLDPVPLSGVTCLYTSTPDEVFVVVRAGPVIVASPCSGHGFKFAPLIGRLVADLADGARPSARFAFRT